MKWPLFFALICFSVTPPTTTAQPAKTFVVLQGSTAPDSLRHGTMLKVTQWRITNADTLHIWAERTTKKRAPQYSAAESADRVVWCYPSKYPDKRHLFPDAEVVLSLSGHQDGKLLILFASEKAYRTHYANELGWEAVDMH